MNFFHSLILSFLFCFSICPASFYIDLSFYFCLKFNALYRSCLESCGDKTDYKYISTRTSAQKHICLLSSSLLNPAMSRPSCLTVTQIISLVNSCFWAWPQSIVHTAARIIIFLTCKSHRVTVIVEILQ